VIRAIERCDAEDAMALMLRADEVRGQFTLMTSK
jgi:hypothetical protein